MAGRIGSDLNRARTRREIDLSEAEAATRIRARFLVAIENEEWSALPGGVYSRAFIRTYASYLGLDGERLAEDYRREVEGDTAPRYPDAAPAPAPAGVGGGARRGPGVGWIALAVVALATGVAVFAIPNGDGGEEEAPAPRPPGESRARAEEESPTLSRPVEGVSLRLAAKAEVWVCLLSDAGQPLLNGQILEAGAEEGPFRSGSFTLSFGNGEVTMTIDGSPVEIPPTPNPVGYAIDPSGALGELTEAERPTCA